MTTFETLVERLVETFRDAKNNSVSRDTLNRQIDLFQRAAQLKHESGRFVYGKQKREAFRIMIRVLCLDLYKRDLTLGYEYNGEIYCPYNKPAIGRKSTEDLHQLPVPLTSDQWDSLPKFDIWIHSGKIY